MTRFKKDMKKLFGLVGERDVGDWDFYLYCFGVYVRFYKLHISEYYDFNEREIMHEE